MAKKAATKTKPASTKAGKSSGPADATQAASAPSSSPPEVGQLDVSRFQSFRTERLPRSVIQLATYNPRTIDRHSKRRLKDSIKAHGLVETIVVNRRTNFTLVAGHQRIAQIDELEKGTAYNLDVAVVDVDETQERVLNIAPNNTNLTGNYDMDMLGNLLAEIADSGTDITATGFDRADLGTLMDEGQLDQIFGSVASEQIEAESPILDAIGEIKESSRPTAAVSSVPPQSVPDSVAGPDPLPIPDHSSARATEIERMKSDRRSFIAKSQDANASEFYVVLVAGTESQANAFLSALRLPTDNRYIDMSIIADHLGIDMGEDAQAQSAIASVGRGGRGGQRKK